MVYCSQDNRQTPYMRGLVHTERDRSHVLDSEPNQIQMPDVRMPDWHRTGRESKYDITGPNHSGQWCPSAKKEIERGRPMLTSSIELMTNLHQAEKELPVPSSHKYPSFAFCGINTISIIGILVPYNGGNNRTAVSCQYLRSEV